MRVSANGLYSHGVTVVGYWRMRSVSVCLTTGLVALALSLTAVRAGAGESRPPRPDLWLGAAWYPEQWPESRWEADLALMQAAHIHVVRITEFAWSKLEPVEGQYDLDWLQRAIDLAAKHDIYVVLGTPSATPPAWLTQKYPETLRVEEDGLRAEHGNRQQASFASAKYRELCRAIVEKMAQRFGHNANVIGWQIDNEYGNVSIDAGTRAMFQDWLRQRYGALDELNRRWTTEYWSQSYSDWSQIPIPVHAGKETGNPGLLMSWKRFVTATWRSYQKNQIDVIRANSEGRQFITTNTMGWYDGYDHYETAKDLDFSAWDDYVGDGRLWWAWNGAAHDLTRGLKQKNFWVMETQPGFVNWAPVNVSLNKGQVRLMAWHDIAHGAEAVSYWQWRSALNGQEQYHGTLVGADGTPVPVYAEIQQEGAEFERAGPVLKDTHPESQVAILNSWENRWAIEWQRHTDKFDPVAQLVSYYTPLREISQSIDIIPITAELASYKVVVAPAYNLLTTEQAAHLTEYVRGGGNLVLGPRSAMKDVDDGLQPLRQPGPLQELLGGRVEEFYALPADVPVSGDLGPMQATIWAELLSASGPDTKVVLRYGKANGWLDDKPAMITRKVGKGSITYIGACFGDAGMKAIAQWMQTQFGLTTPLPGVPEGVEASRRYGQDHVVTILGNFTAEDKDVTLRRPMQDVLSGGSTSKVHLAGYGVAVLNSPR